MSEYYMNCEGCKTEVTIEIDGYLGSLEDYWCEDCGFDGENMEKTLFTIEEIRKHVDDGDMSDLYLSMLKQSLEVYDKHQCNKPVLLEAMSVLLHQSQFYPKWT